MDIKSYDAIYKDARNYIIAHQDKLTDFNDGSVLSSLVESFAREVSNLYIKTLIGFSAYLRGLPYSIFDFKMKDGMKASVNVIFSRSKPFSYTSTIPIGSTSSAGPLKFLTTELGSIELGEISSAPITAIAEGVGEKYNVGAGLIKTIVSTLPTDIIAVNNPGAATGGIDGEDWGAYVDRFGSYILGLSRTNGYGFLSGLTEDHLVRSLQIDEHFPPVDNIWNMTVYLEDGSGSMTEDAIAEVKKRIDGDRTIGSGGYRAPGIHVRYLTPEIVPVSLSVEVATERDVTNDIDTSVVVFEVIEATKKFVNGLLIGNPVLISDVIVMLKRISYIDDVKVPGQDNIEISSNQIARFESCNVEVLVQ